MPRSRPAAGLKWIIEIPDDNRLSHHAEAALPSEKGKARKGEDAVFGMAEHKHSGSSCVRILFCAVK